MPIKVWKLLVCFNHFFFRKRTYFQINWNSVSRQKFIPHRSLNKCSFRQFGWFLFCLLIYSGTVIILLLNNFFLSERMIFPIMEITKCKESMTLVKLISLKDSDIITVIINPYIESSHFLFNGIFYLYLWWLHREAEGGSRAHAALWQHGPCYLPHRRWLALGAFCLKSWFICP